MGPKPLSCLFCSLLDVVFPPVCLLCGRKTLSGSMSTCPECWAKARPIDGPVCKKCGLPILSQDRKELDIPYLCLICRKTEWRFDLARAGYIFDGPVKDAIHMMKYQGHFGMGRWLGDKMAEILAENNYLAEDNYYNRGDKTKDLIISVPLSPERLREREFNQSVILADSVGSALGIPVYHRLLERLNGDRPQVGLTTKERWSNVRGKFLVRSPEIILNKRIVLVDDVMTTGATVNECARALKRKGASSVEVWTLARTIQN